MEISVHTFVSLDGVMQGPGGAEEDTSDGFTRGGWLVPHSQAGQLDCVDRWFRQADAFLLGRTTFELMRGYWPQVTDPDNLVATALNTWPKYVVSNTLADADAAWGNTSVLRGDDIVAQVRRLKERPGGELQVHGSWRLVRTLHDAGSSTPTGCCSSRSSSARASACSPREPRRRRTASPSRRWRAAARVRSR
ncbi:dihydrofolate reductase family protein [Micromonospora sp. URMC 106]|uniref:dihydrofolate reductase family protein n=1 Tax=Micromonospora sp. URMC 106 TaxID=3423408 RepID=UPI003F1AC536